MSAFFVLELAQIVALKPPQTLGAFVEYPAAGGGAVRRSFLRAPRCSVCAQHRPPRFAWNATFGSPDVKNARA
jgi:hypothetical protein